MPPNVRDRRVKARHPKPSYTAPTPTPITFPAIPQPSKLAAAHKPGQIFNPNRPALSFNAPSTTLAKGHVLGLPTPIPGPDIGPNILDPGNLDPIGKLFQGQSPAPEISGIASGISDTLGWLVHPARLVKIVGGGILIVMGLHQLTKQLTGASPGAHAHKLGESIMSAAALIPK